MQNCRGLGGRLARRDTQSVCCTVAECLPEGDSVLAQNRCKRSPSRCVCINLFRTYRHAARDRKKAQSVHLDGKSLDCASLVAGRSALYRYERNLLIRKRQKVAVYVSYLLEIAAGLTLVKTLQPWLGTEEQLCRAVKRLQTTSYSSSTSASQVAHYAC